MRLVVKTSHGLVREFCHFWGKTVSGFNPRYHCINSLVGVRYPAIRPDMDAETIIDVPSGQLFYFCGVSHSFELSRNLHLAGRVKPGATSIVQTAAGTEVSVDGLEQIQISDKDARSLFPDLGEPFLRCRNFQFAAQMFGKPCCDKQSDLF